MDADDEDMVVVIIGDEENCEDASASEIEVTVKQEPLDDIDSLPLEEILETITKHGEFIEIKKEPEQYDQYEQLEDDDEYDPDDPPYTADEEEEDIAPKRTTRSYRRRKKRDSDSSEEEVKPTSTYRRRGNRQKRIFGPRPDWRKHKPFSYIQQLRDENPDFRESPAKLVDHLAELMRKLRPPKLPADVVSLCEENGVLKYLCSKCDVEADSLGAAQRHYQRFHGEFYLMCYACGIKFTNSTNLYKHEKKCKARDAPIVLKARGQYLGLKGRGRPFCTDHRFRPRGEPENKGRHYCSQCPASYVHKDNLRAHELTHAGRRPYSCHFCAAAYTSEVALKRHLATHGDYKFECDDCGKKFKLKPLLVSHMNVHRPLARHPCPACDRRFARRITMQQHYNKKHLQLPHQHGCPVCTKRYARMSHVREHMKKAHGLAIITKRMFLQNLPKMSDLTLPEAKVVFKNETLLDLDSFKNEETESKRPQTQEHRTMEDQETEDESQSEEEEESQAEGPQTEDEHHLEEVYEETPEECNLPKTGSEGEEVSIQYIMNNDKVTLLHQNQADAKLVKRVNPREDNSIESFLRTIKNVKPGTKVVAAQKVKPKTQYLKAPEVPATYQPKVKVYYQPEY